MLKRMNIKSDRANPRFSQAAHVAMQSTMFSAPLRGSGLGGMILLKDLELKKDLAEMIQKGTVLTTDGTTGGDTLYRYDYKLLANADHLLNAQKSINAELTKRGGPNLGLDLLVSYILIQALSRSDDNSCKFLLAYKTIEHFSKQILVYNAASLSLTKLLQAIISGRGEGCSTKQDPIYLSFNDYSPLAIEHATAAINSNAHIICNYLGLRYNCRGCDNHDGCKCSVELQLFFSADHYCHEEILNIIKSLQQAFKHLITMFIEETT
ncbi:MAG: hypothetical protein IT292_00660 [Deltaproteobacteria bacterium]|nr:hypothetical protein [Deltaproteobacteria bacterium]